MSPYDDAWPGEAEVLEEHARERRPRDRRDDELLRLQAATARCGMSAGEYLTHQAWASLPWQRRKA